jgi:hypothetical protein
MHLVHIVLFEFKPSTESAIIHDVSICVHLSLPTPPPLQIAGP